MVISDWLRGAAPPLSMRRPGAHRAIGAQGRSASGAARAGSAMQLSPASAAALAHTCGG